MLKYACECTKDGGAGREKGGDSVCERTVYGKNNKKRKREIRNEYVERSLKYIRFRISVDFIFNGFLKKKRELKVAMSNCSLWNKSYL